MCWSIPGKIIDINGNEGTVEISGVRKKVMLDLLTDPKKNEYILVHAGYGIQKVKEEDANFTIDFFKGKNNA